MARKIIKFAPIGDSSFAKNLPPIYEHPDDVEGGTYYEVPYQGRRRYVIFKRVPEGQDLDEVTVRQMVQNRRRTLYFEQLGEDKFCQVVPVEAPMSGITSGVLRVMRAGRVMITPDDPLAKRLQTAIESAEYPIVHKEIEEMSLGEVARFSSIIGIFYESGVYDRLRAPVTRSELFEDLRRWNGYCLARLGMVVPDAVSDRPLQWGSMQPVIKGLLSKYDYDLITLPGVAEVGSHPECYTLKRSLDASLFLGRSTDDVLSNIPAFATVLRDDFNERVNLVRGSNPIAEAENLVLGGNNNPFRLAERYAHKWIKLNDGWRESGAPIEVLHGVSNACAFLAVHRWNPFLEEGYKTIVNRRWIFSDTKVCISTKPVLVRTIRELNENLNQLEAATSDQREHVLGESSNRFRGNLAALRSAMLRDIESNDLQIREMVGGRYEGDLGLLDGFNDNAHFLVNAVDPLIKHPKEAFLLMGEWRERRKLG